MFNTKFFGKLKVCEEGTVAECLWRKPEQIDNGELPEESINIEEAAVRAESFPERFNATFKEILEGLNRVLTTRPNKEIKLDLKVGTLVMKI